MFTSQKWALAQRLEIMWWKRYLRKQTKAEYLDWKSKYWLGFLKDCSFNEPPQKQNILDAGCGPAGIFTVLDKNKVDAIDPLLNQYQNGISQFDKIDYPWVQFSNTSIEDFNTENQYDIIFCINAINHVRDLKASLQKLKSLLKHNGRLYLTTDCHNTRVLKPLFRLIPGDALHPHQHNRADYELLLKHAGFLVETCQVLKKAPIFDYYLFELTKK